MVSSNEETITLTEVDESNHPTATYIYSQIQEPSTSPDGKIVQRGRVDVMHPSSPPPARSLTTLVDLLIDVFLPSGYPHSVTDDYLPYQIFDSLQAFCSSIAGLLSSRAVLQGVGVGNANASPTSALLLHILQDSSGRIATILFAHRVGTALEPECKMYRLAADVFNDLAMILDCLSPMIPAGVGRVTVLSTAGILRALCGVAGGSSKASLSAHFARGGNLAEVNAKDSSQETIISLIGMLVGSFVVSHITSFAGTWTSLLLLLATHLGLNYTAVRAVQMTSLNRQRANILFSTVLDSDPALPHLLTSPAHPSTAAWQTLTPAQVSRRETIFETDGVLKWTPTSASTPAIKLGYCQIGLSVDELLHLDRSPRSSRGKTSIPIADLTALFAKEDYLLYLAREDRPDHWRAGIVLKSGCSVRSQLKAWMHALLAARVLSAEADELIMEVIVRTLGFLNRDARFEAYLRAFERVGWDLNLAVLETRTGRRIAS